MAGLNVPFFPITMSLDASAAICRRMEPVRSAAKCPGGAIRSDVISTHSKSERIVTVGHRLIAENTVESVIQRVHARKQCLADALFEGRGRGPLGLTGEDIDVLFGPAQTGSPAGPRTR